MWMGRWIASFVVSNDVKIIQELDRYFTADRFQVDDHPSNDYVALVGNEVGPNLCYL